MSRPSRQRAQGMPDARCTRGRLCRKKAQASATKGTPQQPAFPAQWCYGLYVISPVTSLVATVISGSYRRLSACIGAPGPHDFAVRTTAARRANIAPGAVRPSHPKPHVRDDRETPLWWAGTAETVNVIWGNREAEYFRFDGWTGFRAHSFFARRANRFVG